MGGRRARLAAAVAGVLALLGGMPASAHSPAPPLPLPLEDEVTPAARDAALRRAIRFVDENLPKMQEGGSPQKAYATATAAWAGLLLGARRGAPNFDASRLESLRDSSVRYVESVARAYDRSAKEGEGGRKGGKKDPPAAPPVPGLPDGFGMPGAATQFAWPLSMATHLLAESAARGWRKGESLEALRKAVAVLEASQQPDGGWGHDDASRPGMGLPPLRIPKPWGKGELVYPGTLLSASNLALSALGTAHRVLGTRKTPSLDRGRKYFADAQSDDGTFPYDPSQRASGGAAAGTDFAALQISRTAGSLFALGCAGARPDDPVLLAAARALEGKTALLSEGHGSATLTLQMAALACKARGSGTWTEFRNEFFPRILAAQDPDGAFRCVCREVCPGVICDGKPLPFPGADAMAAGNRVYVTALHVLILSLDEVEPKAPPRIEVRPPQPTPR